MKKLKPTHIIQILIIAFVLYQIVPRTIRNLSSEGTMITPVQISNMATNRNVTFPPYGNSLAIFWATWCQPCKLEMKRLKTSVLEGKIPQDKIFAINPFEDRATVEKFLKSESFPFTFIDVPEMVKELKVEVTPTILLIEDGKILSRSSGVSLFGIWRAEFLFR